MGDSLKFEHIETNLVKLFDLLQGNQNIHKLVYYLNSENPITETNVEVDLYEHGYYFLTPFDDTIPETEMVKIYLNSYSGSLKKLGIGDIMFQIDIVMPNTKWLIPSIGKLRAFSIANEFNKMIDQKNVAGIGNSTVEGFKVFKVDGKYSGLSMFINTKTSTLKKEGVSN